MLQFSECYPFDEQFTYVNVVYVEIALCLLIILLALANVIEFVIKKWAWSWDRGALRNFEGLPLIFLQRVKLTNSNLLRSSRLPRPIIKSYPEKKEWVALFQGSSSKFLGSPIIFRQGLGLATSHLAHHKIIRRRQGAHGPGLGEIPKFRWFPFNIYTMAEASDFKFGTQLGFSKAHHKITSKEKRGWPWARGAPQNFGVPL